MNDKEHPTGIHTRHLKAKLDEVAVLLRSGNGHINGATKSSKELLPASELSTHLFSKAPVEFINERSATELGSITTESYEVLEELLANKSAFAFQTKTTKERISCIIALGDRPFIVSSIAESARESNIEITLFLHPILSLDGKKYSLSYIEILPVADDRLTVFRDSVERALRDLMNATDDFGSMVVRVDDLAQNLESQTKNSLQEAVSKREASDFLQWIIDGSYIFLGHAEWTLNKEGALSLKPSTALGIFKSHDDSYREQLIRESREDAVRTLSSANLLNVTKLRVESRIHRRLALINISIREESEGKPRAIHSLVGLLTSKAITQESSSVPLIRRKLRELIELEEVHDNSYDYKFIVDTIDRMPKEEALCLDTESLRAIIETAIGVHHQNHTRLWVSLDKSERGASVLLVVPRDRFNSDVRRSVQQYLEEVFHAVPGSAEYHLDFTRDPQVRLYFYIPIPAGAEHGKIDVKRWEKEILKLSRGWLDNLEERLLSSRTLRDPEVIARKYLGSFPPEYQAVQSVEQSEADIESMETLTESGPVAVRFRPGVTPGSYVVLIYKRDQEISLSQALPVLENAGLEVITSNTWQIAPRPGTPIYIHHFLVQIKRPGRVDQKVLDDIFAPGIAEVLLGNAENDSLNSLLLSGPLTIRAIGLLRAYACLLWQVNKFATRGAIFEALASVPASAVAFWKLFDLKFNPELQISVAARGQQFANLLNGYRDSLREVSEITKDRILRSLVSLLEHTVRTNFYLNRSALALKIHSEKVDVIPAPKPMYEIFVRSRYFEGVHLRASKVARGGIRWSERNDDYRSEVLGLMKTQKIKNVLIVPSGAKGGFAVRYLPKEPSEVPKVVEEHYKSFIRALLSIADNRVNDRVKHPQDVIIYDEPDPYFVVAADKGTATFSDVANKIAIDEYSFWLNDAFASGGSKGYDHKKYGITAKGAWECVKRLFHDIGLDYVSQPFTAIGIGDMSGDVFGNGLLLSDKVKLVAAFNHKHIFVDPDPDPVVSFAERKRLFELPRSQWSDYDRSLISKGGGIFERFSKEILLTPELRTALGIAPTVPDSINGEELIAAILRAPVDLLWNGGIGTYVKSRFESHADVNDGTNDRVRVNADELRVKVVGEGGNLGFTQRARIEFALEGGQINTDAIDNSGGVDLSDHEVNIKILFSELLRSGKVTLQERDQMMLDMAPAVIKAVLDHNKSHAAMLSMAVARSKKSVTYFQSLLRQMTKLGYINRSLDFLPEDEDLVERSNRKGGLSRPELAICLAAVKMWIKDVLLGSELIKDPLLKGYLLEYFPEVMRERFKDEIFIHPLGPNIIATQVTNTLVDAVGITFIHRMCLNYSVTPIAVIKCSLAAELVLGSRTVRAALSKFDNFSDNQLFLTLRREVSKSLRDGCAWFISYHGEDLTLDQIVELYRSSFLTVIQHTEEVLSGEELATFEKRFAEYQSLGFDEFVARRLSAYPFVVSIFEMLWTARESGKNIRAVAKVYSHVMEALGITTILKLENLIEPSNKWEHQVLVNSHEEIRKSISRITCRLLDRGALTRPAVIEEIRKSRSFEQLVGTIEEIRESVPTVAALSVIGKQLRGFEL